MALDESVEVEDGAVPENWLYEVPPTEAVQKADRARKELEKLGAEVRFAPKWWGFEVHLNQPAVDNYLEIKDLIAEVLSEALKEPLSTMVTWAAMAQKLWVEAVSRGYGCKLVSPWISPTMLIPKGLGPQEDLNMWWTVYEPGQGWNEDQKFVAHQSGANPALAGFNGRLVCVHRGGTDNNLWYTAFDPDSGWTKDTKIGGMSTDGPALAVFGG
ncbi:hypothetical protein ABZY81_41020 [Streptomyces sp. NPDC006514]|uniref:hypothetical protein n=1 Tax=Streptomyces sp. NPDC006514 TaxID=3154308 RepID=UPI0033A2897F